MGYILHHALLVTAYNIEWANTARDKAEIFPETVVSDLHRSVTNGYWHFAVFPDGSKEGWPDSDAMDARRQEYIDWLDAQRFPDNSSPYAWVLVAYGGVPEDVGIVRHDGDVPVKEED